MIHQSDVDFLTSYFFHYHSYLLRLPPETSGVIWTGTIPSEIGLLSTWLQVLHIENARFGNNYGTTTSTSTTGGAGASTIPDAIYELTQLRELKIVNSNLTGTISGTKISQLSKLEILDLSDNKLTGTIPATEIICSSLSNLNIIKLRGNNLVSETGHDVLRNRTINC